MKAQQCAFAVGFQLIAAIFALVTTLSSFASGAAPADPLAGDERLARRVQVIVEGLPLGELLPLLGEKTDVALTAAADIADEKVIVFGPPRPLRELLADLAALFNTRWERRRDGDDGRTHYLLQRGARAAAYENSLIRAATQRMMDALEAQAPGGDGNGAVAPVPDLPPILARDYRPEYRRFARLLYAQLGTRQREQLFAQKRFAVLFSALTPPQQAPIRAAFTRLMAEQQAWRDERARDEPGRPLPMVVSAETMERGTLRFYVLTKEGDREVRVNIGTPDSGLLVGKIDDRDLWLLAAHGNPFTGERIRDDAALPTVAVVRDAGRERIWIDRLRALAGAGKMPVVADYYRYRRYLAPPVERAPAADTPAAVLDALCAPEGSLWWLQGKSLLLRKRDWYQHRLYEPPDRWMQAMARRLQARGGKPTYGDVLTLRELTPTQIHGLNGLGVNFEDEHNLPALRALLAVVAASPRTAGMPVPMSRGVPREVLESITLRYPSLSQAQRGLLPTFLALHDEPVAAADVALFHTYCYLHEDMPRAKSSGYADYRYWLVGINWGLDIERSWTYRAGLPASLPDDRRERTKVMVLE